MVKCTMIILLCLQIGQISHWYLEVICVLDPYHAGKWSILSSLSHFFLMVVYCNMQLLCLQKQVTNLYENCCVFYSFVLYPLNFPAKTWLIFNKLKLTRLLHVCCDRETAICFSILVIIILALSL